MNKNEQILLAFLIPFSMAIGLLVLRMYVFYDSSDPWIYRPGNAVGFPAYEPETPKQLQIIGLFVGALLSLSIVLPSFVSMRIYQNRRNKSVLKLNIE
jgi:hypothetical protein